MLTLKIFLSCCYFWNFFEHFLTLFWRSLPHLVKDGVTPYTDTAPAHRTNLEDDTKWIADEPVEETYSITGTKYSRCFTLQEFFWENNRFFRIFISKSRRQNHIKEIFQNCRDIDPPNRENKDELICCCDFILKSFLNRTADAHFSFFFITEKIHTVLRRIEIENFYGMTIFFFCFLVFPSYCMSEPVRAGMSGDNESVHTLTIEKKRKDKRGLW